MKKKSLLPYSFVLPLSIIISLGISINFEGCAERKVAVDLVAYVNQEILDIANLEKTALSKYASVTGVNYKNEHDVYETLKNDVIPVYKRFLELLKKIRPETDEVSQLHIIYVNGSEMLYSGFVYKQQALERKDASYLLYANKQIEKGRIETERWRKKLMELYKQVGVKEGK